MKITYKGDYAIKTIMDLASHYSRSPVTIHDLSARADIPVKFLEQILLDLKRGGFVESRRGKTGGYFLNKSPDKIRLGEIVRFIDGPIEPVSCVNPRYKGCRDIKSCVFKSIWEQVTASTAKIIDNITFEDLVKKVKQQETVVNYSI